jgi:BirA family biotin operon repressor/biotin-[acetyl-CoA-carboxylase] ligase
MARVMKSDPEAAGALRAWRDAGWFFHDAGDSWEAVDGPGLLTRARLLRALHERPSEFRWRVRSRVTTTMTLAREDLMATDGPVAVLADRQTEGRGRRGRTWLSAAGGGLHLSLAWRPGRTEVLPDALTLRVGLAAARAVEEVTGAHLGLKWPNDGMVRDMKCMGVLCEAGRGPGPWVVVGVGVNVNGPPPEHVAGATSLERETGRPWPRVDLAAAVAAAVDEVRRGDDADMWLAAYRARSEGVTLNRRVRIIGSGGPEFEGVAVDVDDAGGLAVLRDDGTQVRVIAGEVSVRPVPPLPPSG